MKMLFCADVRLGAICTENLNSNQSKKWQAVRNQRFTDLLDIASQNNAKYVALFGRLFGQNRVSESVIDVLFKALREDDSIHLLAFLDEHEFKRVSYRNDIPKNLHLIGSQATYLDDDVAIRTDGSSMELQLAEHKALTIKRIFNKQYAILGLSEESKIPFFEPVGFEDAQGLSCGYGILEWTDDDLGKYTFKPNQLYTYKAVEVRILPEDNQNEILRKINYAIKGVDVDSFVRVTITGRSALGLTIGNTALKNHLQSRIFFAEVYDNTMMDIDEAAFENDISLRSEFVRLALQDDSLSDSERNRLISYGWNALNGGEVPLE